MIQITDQEAEQLSKTEPNEAMSVSERLLIESAAEKDRISEAKVRPCLECHFFLVTLCDSVPSVYHWGYFNVSISEYFFIK